MSTARKRNMAYDKAAIITEKLIYEHIKAYQAWVSSGSELYSDEYVKFREARARRFASRDMMKAMYEDFGIEIPDVNQKELARIPKDDTSG